MRRTRRMMAVLLALAFGACSPSPSPDEVLEGVTAARPTPPIEKPGFTFTDTEGEAYDFRAETEGRLALLFFGYTYCPDVCPLQMARIATALDSVPPELRERIEVVFVSVDPKRDTPERLATWLGNFDPGFVGLTAPQEEVDALMGSLDFPPTMFPEGTEGDDYGVGHPGMVWGFTPDGAGRLLWFGGVTAEDYRKDMVQVASHRW
ncbi:MAG: SCO family protein [Gemmatimonadetes bacterium]|nr:SCO family protein [Gemmatimonadota bacterium]